MAFPLLQGYHLNFSIGWEPLCGMRAGRMAAGVEFGSANSPCSSRSVNHKLTLFRLVMCGNWMGKLPTRIRQVLAMSQG